jgi:hypothetical protein
MKTTLFEASESIGVLDKLGEQIFNGRLSLKICDMLDAISKKSNFLDKEIRKIVEHYGATAMDPQNNDSRMVVKNADGSVDEEKTKEFIDKVIEIRKTEVDIDVEPFTMDDMDAIKLSTVEVFKIRWLIDRDS